MTNYLYFVFDYCDKMTNKRRAQVVKVASNGNIKSVVDGLAKITSTTGAAAALEIVAYMPTRSKADETADTWNNTYKKENRLFKY